MSNTAIIIWKSVGVSLVALLLIAAVVCGVMMKPSEAPCRSLTYIIEDREDRLYLTENELNQLLTDEALYPVGKSVSSLSLHRIESTIRRHPMVRTAECYLTPRMEVKIRLTQRIPLLRVQTPGETYFIDTDRRVMPVRTYVKDSVLVVTGAVGVQMASGAVAEFAEWLQDSRYWQPRVHHVYVQNPRMVYVYLKGQPRAVLGTMAEYESKLNKLRVFLEKGQEAIEDKHYTEYDLRFKGQVIGRY